MPRRSDDRDSQFHVSVICTGNICRSPMAAIVLARAIDEAGLADRVRVTSAGTGPWHVGGPAHSSTRTVLEEHGYSTAHVARQIDRDELQTIDLALAADKGHLKALRKMDKPEKFGGKVGKNRSGDETPDPEKTASEPGKGKVGKRKGDRVKAGRVSEGTGRTLRPTEDRTDRIVLFRSLDPAAVSDDLDLPDPYGGPEDGYHEVMAMVQSAVPGIVTEIRRRLDAG